MDKESKYKLSFCGYDIKKISHVLFRYYTSNIILD